MWVKENKNKKYVHPPPTTQVVLVAEAMTSLATLCSYKHDLMGPKMVLASFAGARSPLPVNSPQGILWC